MALMDAAEVSGFCQDVARLARVFSEFHRHVPACPPSLGEDQLSDDGLLAIMEFRSCFHAALAREDALGGGWQGKAALLVAADPETRKALLPEDRAREAMEALIWAREWAQKRETRGDLLSLMSVSYQAHRDLSEHASTLSALQEDLRRHYYPCAEPIPHMVALLEGMAHVDDVGDLADALRASPDYLYTLSDGPKIAALKLAGAAANLLAPLLPGYNRSEKVHETAQKIQDKLRTLLPEIDQPDKIAFLPAHQALRNLVERWREKHEELGVIADSSLLQSVQIAAAALHDDPVLILGPTGTGKELSARAIHAMGRRADGPFKAFNCASVPPALVESELFGYEKGSHYRADSLKKGLVEEASGGTLLLDEIGRASLEVQYALLRTLSDKVIRRVGGTKEIKVDVRFVFATSGNLFKFVSEGDFLPDLHHRLRPDFALYLRPIKDRPFDDVKTIWESLVRKAEEDLRKKTANSTGQGDAPSGSEYKAGDDMIERIRGRSWPGNIRQLEYVTRELVRRRGIGGLLWDSFVVEDVFRKIDENPNQLPQERAEPVIPAVAVNKPPPAWPSPPVVADAVKALALAKDIDSVIDNLENALIEETLSEVGKDRAQAAARLGLTPGALTKRMARLKKRLASRSPSISPAKP